MWMRGKWNVQRTSCFTKHLQSWVLFTSMFASLLVRRCTSWCSTNYQSANMWRCWQECVLCPHKCAGGASNNVPIQIFNLMMVYLLQNSRINPWNEPHVFQMVIIRATILASALYDSNPPPSLSSSTFILENITDPDWQAAVSAALRLQLQRRHVDALFIRRI